jgi:hypothetical protein
MSYSRWSDSVWYTYWSSFSGKSKDSQVMEIMVDCYRTFVFTYSQLNEDLDDCISSIVRECGIPKEVNTITDFDAENKPVYSDVKVDPIKFTQGEIFELEGYIKTFINDVNYDFGPIGRISNFMMKSKIKPLRLMGSKIYYSYRPKINKNYGL